MLSRIRDFLSFASEAMTLKYFFSEHFYDVFSSSGEVYCCSEDNFIKGRVLIQGKQHLKEVELRQQKNDCDMVFISTPSNNNNDNDDNNREECLQTRFPVGNLTTCHIYESSYDMTEGNVNKAMHIEQVIEKMLNLTTDKDSVTSDRYDLSKTICFVEFCLNMEIKELEDGRTISAASNEISNKYLSSLKKISHSCEKIDNKLCGDYLKFRIFFLLPPEDLIKLYEVFKKLNMKGIFGRQHTTSSVFEQQEQKYGKFKQINAIFLEADETCLLDKSVKALSCDDAIKKLLVMLCRCIPKIYHMKSYRLIYSTETHGYSLHSLYRECLSYKEVRRDDEEETPCLLVICSSTGERFGSFLNVLPAIKIHYSGDGMCFLFKEEVELEKKAAAASVNCYKWKSDSNCYFLYCSTDYLSIGGGDGKCAIYIDSDFNRGISDMSITFENNRPLTQSKDFKIVNIYLYALV